MSSFKPKVTKKIKINKKNLTTLDGKHNEFLHNFNKDLTNNIPILKEQKKMKLGFYFILNSKESLKTERS